MIRVAIIVFFALAGAFAQVEALPSTPAQAPIEPGVLSGDSQLTLDPATDLALRQAMRGRDYKKAEKLLVEEADRDPQSLRAGRLLAMAGGVYFLDGQYLESITVWKRAEGIAPLDEASRFTLAMAYIRLNRRDRARPELEKLSSSQPRNALFLYWLARLDYDAHDYVAAIGKFERVIALDPKMERAYDNLGLCQDYVGRVDDAIKDYERAIELNRQQSTPSPWPHLDLAVALIEKDQLREAETTLREAIGYDPHFAEAHYELGRVLNKLGRNQEAIESLKQAVALDAAFAAPHYLLGRIYHRIGETELSKREIDRFLELTKTADKQSLIQSPPRTTPP